MTSRHALAFTLLGSLALTGCVSKTDYEALQQQLTECQNDKRSAQDAATGLQKRLGDDDERWRNLQATLAAFPDMQKDFEEDRKKILTMVPSEIRSQVGAKLDKHFADVTRRLTDMQRDVSDTNSQLTAAREEITALRGQTEGVAQKVDATNDAVLGENAELKRALDAQRSEASQLVKKVTDFDANYLNCADCEERLKMKERSRDALRTLHGDLVTGLSKLQGPAK